MSSVGLTGTGVSTVLQTLLSNSPGLSSSLSSSVQSALESASPSDVVEFSKAALDLQEAGGLFGSAPNSESTPDFTNLLDSLAQGSGSSASPAQLAAYQSGLQLQQDQELFGTSGTSTVA